MPRADNERVIQLMSEVLLPRYAELFKLLYRPLLRGSGITINTEYLKQLEKDINDVHSDAEKKAMTQAARKMGFKSFSEIDCAGKSGEFFDLKDKIKHEIEKTTFTPEIAEKAYVLAIGEWIKALNSGSFIPAKFAFGIHSRHVEGRTEEIQNIANVLDKIARGDLRRLIEREEADEQIAAYGISAETMRQKSVENNQMLMSMLDPNNKVAKALINVYNEYKSKQARGGQERACKI